MARLEKIMYGDARCSVCVFGEIDRTVVVDVETVEDEQEETVYTRELQL